MCVSSERWQEAGQLWEGGNWVRQQAWMKHKRKEAEGTQLCQPVGLNACSVPEQPGLLTAIPDSFSPILSLPSFLALIAYSQPQSPLHKGQAKAFIPKRVKDWGVPCGWRVLQG